MENNLTVFQNIDTFKFGFKDKNGRVIIQPIYDQCFNFSEGLAACNFHGKWGFINEFGSVVIPFQYFDVRAKFSSGVVGVKINDLWGFINKSNILIIKCKYLFIYQDFEMVHGVNEPVAIVGLMTKNHRHRQTRMLINRINEVLMDDID